MEGLKDAVWRAEKILSANCKAKEDSDAMDSRINELGEEYEIRCNTLIELYGHSLSRCEISQAVLGEMEPEINALYPKKYEWRLMYWNDTFDNALDRTFLAGIGGVLWAIPVIILGAIVSSVFSNTVGFIFGLFMFAGGMAFLIPYHREIKPDFVIGEYEFKDYHGKYKKLSFLFSEKLKHDIERGRY